MYFWYIPFSCLPANYYGVRLDQPAILSGSELGVSNKPFALSGTDCRHASVYPEGLTTF